MSFLYIPILYSFFYPSFFCSPIWYFKIFLDFVVLIAVYISAGVDGEVRAKDDLKAKSVYSS